MRVEGSENGWADAPELDGSVRIERREGPAAPRLARLRARLGLAGLARSATRASTRSRRTCTGAGRRSTTGRRTCCARSTGRCRRSGVDGRVLRARARAPRARANPRHGARRLSCRRRLVRAPELRQEQIIELRAGERPALADEDANLDHLAVAQEAMRDRLDLTGVVASFGGPLLVCVGDRRRDRLRRRGERARGDRARREARGVPGRGALRRGRPAGRVQRGPSRLPEPVEDVTLAELRERLGDDGLSPCSTSGPRSSSTGLPGAHCDPRQGHIPGAVNLPLERILECRSASEVRERRRPARGSRGRRVLPRREPLALRRRGARGRRLPGAQLRRLLARVVARRCPRTELARSPRGGTRRPARGPGAFDLLHARLRLGAQLGGRHRELVRVLLDPRRRPSAASPRRGTGCPRRAAARRNACGQTRCARARSRRPGPRMCSGATGTPSPRGGRRRARDRRRPRGERDVEPSDLRRAAGPTAAPAARASICAPRQTPNTGTRAARTSRRNSSSLASQPKRSSWSGCIEPPNTITAS